MTNFIFGLLEEIGFTHPLHPAATHIPMGMVMGCFFFGLFAWLNNSESLKRTSFHCTILALIFIVPTIFAGILDWQYLFGGSWQTLIMIKMLLAGVLTILLIFSLKMHRDNASTKNIFFIYLLCVCCAAGLGFSGGELVYGG